MKSIKSRVLSRVCVCDITWAIHQLSILYIFTKTKIQILYLDPSLQLLEVFPWRLLIFLTWSKLDPKTPWITTCKLQILFFYPLLSYAPTKILIMNLSLIKHKIISNYNYMSWSSSKLGWRTFGPTISPFLMMTKLMELYMHGLK